jgi:hypothetical protein
VPDAVEADGVCTLTATQGSVSAVIKSSATADATTTQCGTLAFGADQLGSGVWALTLTYDSSASFGRAEPVNVTVP